MKSKLQKQSHEKLLQQLWNQTKMEAETANLLKIELLHSHF